MRITDFRGFVKGDVVAITGGKYGRQREGTIQKVCNVMCWVKPSGLNEAVKISMMNLKVKQRAAVEVVEDAGNKVLQSSADVVIEECSINDKLVLSMLKGLREEVRMLQEEVRLLQEEVKLLRRK